MKKRFIAGAKCPDCGQEDKIYVIHENSDDIALCNACGYRSVRPKTVEPLDHDDPAPTTVVKIQPRRS